MPQEIKYKKPWENTPRSNVFMLRMRNTFHSVLSSRPFVHLTYVSFTNLSEKTELGVFILKCTLGEPGHHANWRTLSKVSVDSASVQMLLLKLLATPALHIFFFLLCITSSQIDEQTIETVTDFILEGLQIIWDGDCSYEIKKMLALWKKKIWPI